MMANRKLDGAVDKSSANQKIRKLDATVHNLWKIWRPAPSGTRSYGRLAGWQNLGKAWNFKSLLCIKYSIFCFI